jgi:hypothetical protein
LFANPASFQLAIAADRIPDIDSIHDPADTRRAMCQSLNLLLEVEARQATTQPQNAIVKLRVNEPAAAAELRVLLQLPQKSHRHITQRGIIQRGTIQRSIGELLAGLDKRAAVT